MIDCQGSHVEQKIMLWGVRGDGADPISSCQLEELMPEHGGGSRSCDPYPVGGSSRMPRSVTSSFVVGNSRWAEAGGCMRPPYA